jgi:acyl dehydratase
VKEAGVIWQSLCWEDIREGQELPTVSREITCTTIVSCAIASGDFLPLHHDREYAQKAGLNDIFMNTPTIFGFAGKYLTDWTGPEGELKGISLRLMMPCFPGDTMTMAGKVDRKYTEADQHLVDVDFVFNGPMGMNCSGKGTVMLPTRIAT